MTQPVQPQAAALPTGKAAGMPKKTPVEVVPYNFQHAPRIAKDQRIAIQGIHARFAFALQSLLSSRLRVQVDVTVTGVEESTLANFQRSLSDPCAAFVFRTGNGAEQGILDLSTEFAFHLVDRLFGGPGETSPVARPLTALEQTVARGMVERVLGLYRETWQDYGELKPEVLAFEASPEGLRVANPTDPVLVATLEVRSGQLTATLSVCLPLGGLERVLEIRGATPRTATSPARRAQLQSMVRTVPVTVTARLPVVRLSAHALANLRPGQVVPIRVPVDALTEVRVNGQLRFHGSLGRLGRRVGVHITDVVTAPPGQVAGVRPGRML